MRQLAVLLSALALPGFPATGELLTPAPALALGRRRFRVVRARPACRPRSWLTDLLVRGGPGWTGSSRTTIPEPRLR